MKQGTLFFDKDSGRYNFNYKDGDGDERDYGSLPVISETTAKLLVPGEDEKFFHHDKRYYVVVLRKAFPSKEFKFHYIRQYVMDMQRLRKM